MGGEGPALGGVARAAAEVHDEASEGLAGSVEGAMREACLGGGAEDVGGFDGFSGRGEELEKPASAEVGVARRGRRLHQDGVAQGGSGQVIPLEDQPEGRRVAAEDWGLVDWGLVDW